VAKRGGGGTYISDVESTTKISSARNLVIMFIKRGGKGKIEPNGFLKHDPSGRAAVEGKEIIPK